jgi:transcriptional regulator with XRE-family HTH domain
MSKALKDVIAALPKEEQEKIKLRGEQLVAEEMSLQELRKTIGKTQTAIAKRLKIGQDAVSKLETRSDMRVSTLREFVEAMGGELELVARFPNRSPVRLEASENRDLRKRRQRHAA